MTHQDYVVARQREEEIAHRAEHARLEREGAAPAPMWRERRFAGRLFARLRPRRPAEAPASTR